jgi:hypothetical protein
VFVSIRRGIPQRLLGLHPPNGCGCHQHQTPVPQVRLFALTTLIGTAFPSRNLNCHLEPDSVIMQSLGFPIQT